MRIREVALQRQVTPFSGIGEQELSRAKLLHASYNPELTLEWVIEGGDIDDVL